MITGVFLVWLIMDLIRILLSCNDFIGILTSDPYCTVIFLSFITYEACKRLDGLHTIFGRLVGGLAVLSALEKQPTYKDSSKASSETHDDYFEDKPINEIKILSTNIVEDPFVNLKINAK